MLLNALGSFLERPACAAHKQVYARATATCFGWAAALVAKPRAGAVLIIEAIAILATAKRTWLVFVGELLAGYTCKDAKN